MSLRKRSAPHEGTQQDKVSSPFVATHGNITERRGIPTTRTTKNTYGDSTGEVPQVLHSLLLGGNHDHRLWNHPLHRSLIGVSFRCGASSHRVQRDDCFTVHRSQRKEPSWFSHTSLVLHTLDNLHISSRYFLGITFFFMYGSPVLQQLARVLPFATLEMLARYHVAVSYALYVIGTQQVLATVNKRRLHCFHLDIEKGALQIPVWHHFAWIRLTGTGQITWTLMTLLVVVAQSSFIIQNIFRGLIW